MEKQKDYYLALFEKNPLAMIVIDKEDLKFLKVNAAAIKVLSYSEEKLLAKTFMDIVPEGEREFLKEQLKKVSEDKDIYLNTKNIKDDGQEIDVELVAIQIEFNNKACILKITTDVTEQKKSKAELKKLNTYLEELFYSAPFAIVLLNKKEQIIKINKIFEETFQYTANEVKDKNLKDLIIPEGFVIEYNEIVQKVKNGKFDRLETKRKRKDNELIDVLAVKFPIIVDDEFLGSYAIYLDISSQIKTTNELKELYKTLENKVKERTIELESAYGRMEEINAELEEIGKTKDKFISIISHDLRNPVAAIVSSSNIILNNIEALKKDEIKNFSGIINTSSKKIIEQLNELVEWSNQKTKKIIFNPQTINLYEFVLFSLKLIQVNANQKNIDIVNNIDTDILVKADPLLLRSIFQNLVTNAIKFTPEGGKITISAQKKEKGFIEISVADTGKGIPEEIRSKLFSNEAFVSEQKDEEGKPKGLGLILVKDFVEKHKGEIWVECKPEKGTTFHFTLPIGK
ncbi:MAG: PAS domain-containing sensor histidine kinase [Bacteroidetes bacterium]|nr:PAS domain-containing sensor histidine kinase [Bacteroidota bacterium]